MERPHSVLLRLKRASSDAYLWLCWKRKRKREPGCGDGPVLFLVGKLTLNIRWHTSKERRDAFPSTPMTGTLVDQSVWLRLVSVFIGLYGVVGRAEHGCR